MFSANLSASILRICEEQNLTYKRVCDYCGVSLRHFENIVAGKASPTIRIFEKLCYGLNVTPDELLLPKEAFYHFSCRFTPSAPLPFSENLSGSLRRICREKGLSCALASEYCDLCSEYFGRIVRGKVSPTILTLEKLCLGLGAAPNQLLLPPGQEVVGEVFGSSITSLPLKSVEEDDWQSIGQHTN